MSEDSYDFAYTDLTHALKTNGLAVARAQQLTTDDGVPVFIVSFRGDCVCGEHADVEQPAFITDLMLVDLIAELIATAFEHGVAVDRLAEMVGRAARHKDLRGPAEGQLFEGCAYCRRPAPECTCLARVVGQL